MHEKKVGSTLNPDSFQFAVTTIAITFQRTKLMFHRSSALSKRNHACSNAADRNHVGTDNGRWLCHAFAAEIPAQTVLKRRGIRFWQAFLNESGIQ